MHLESRLSSPAHLDSTLVPVSSSYMAAGRLQKDYLTASSGTKRLLSRMHGSSDSVNAWQVDSKSEPVQGTGHDIKRMGCAACSCEAIRSFMFWVG